MYPEITESERRRAAVRAMLLRRQVAAVHACLTLERAGARVQLVSGRLDEHGPHQYLTAVAHKAAELEGRGADYTRADAIDVAFGLVPAPADIQDVGPNPVERLYVRQVLEAGDHARDLANLHRGSRA